MNNQEVLQQYSREIIALRKQYRDAGMTEEEFKKLYFDSLEENEIITSNNHRRIIFTKTRLFIVTILLISIGVYNFKSMFSHLQEFVYPSLQILRRISIPLLSLFPSLTEFYHETCLVQNPFFTVVDMECWPCSTVTSIQVFDDPLQGQQHSAPFVYKTEQSVVNMKDLSDLYKNNEIVFEKEASKVFKNSKYYVTQREMFDTHEKSKERNLFIWKFNTMNTALILRQMIPRPKVVPKFGQSTERYLLIDNSEEPFRIPDTDCGYSFVLSLSGSRVIELNPAEECKHQCRTLRIELKETQLLWYNWWYWKPAVLPSFGNETLIAHIGSYC